MADERRVPAEDDAEAAGGDVERRPATDRMLAVLEMVAGAGRAVAVRDVADALDLPKPTAHRLVNALLERSLLARAVDRRAVTVGPKLTDLALDILRATMAQAPARTVLRALAHELGETCNIGVLEGGEVVYLDRVEAEGSPLRLNFGVGSRVPLHCTAMGKLFLATMPPAVRRRIVEGVRLEAHTAHTLSDPAALRAELARVAGRGWSVDDEEYIVGVFCLAVPVADAAGRTVAALAAQAPKARLSLDRLDEVLPRLRRAAAELGAVLGGEDAEAERIECTAGAVSQRRAWS
ncbi:IclR family transcriptional regulator [Azospirillum sp. ST 5-10]|uniref:IclR family transcriptional regulator n=1 Tax=unclassified Azospirillum TaxID=2630922 RepID=UPI003F4A820A